MGIFSRAKTVTPPKTVAPPEVPVLAGVDPSWTALPTLSHGKSEGNPTAQTVWPDLLLREHRGCVGRYGPLVMAELRVVAKGQYAGAVRVFVAGKQVASVPHSMSEEFGRVVLDIEAGGKVATIHVELDMPDPYVDVWGTASPNGVTPTSRPCSRKP